MRSVCLIPCLLCCVLGSSLTLAVTNDSGNAKGGIPREKDRESLAKLKDEAAKGNAEAVFKVGVAYDEGKDVGKDLVEAAKWYRKAADQGYVPATYNLAAMYANGDGVEVDFTQAIRLYKQAADKGYGMAMYNLGCMSEDGRGVEKSFSDAIKWYRDAANKGIAPAMYNLGVMCSEGRGVKKDDAEAIKWWVEAADRKYVSAMHNLGAIYRLGKGVPKNYVEAYKWLSLARRYEDPNETLVIDGVEASSMWIKNLEEIMTPEQISAGKKAVGDWRPRSEETNNATSSTLRQSETGQPTSAGDAATRAAPDK